MLILGVLNNSCSRDGCFSQGKHTPDVLTAMQRLSSWYLKCQIEPV